ncbi:hypothetical protein [Nocardia wallacei]|uniref:hypothetical protein n=1 Tax=Nocardia wallacei TaxID=480035 RepID=UPI0024541DB1|nr:hypothetical protein [Nocardia wallacei]
MTEYDSARWVLAICGIGLAYSAVRDLRAGREYAAGGILSWDVIGAGRLRIFHPLLAWRGYRWVLTAQLIAGGCSIAVFALPVPVAAALAWTLAAACMLTLYRSAQGLDGADQMAALNTIAAAGALTAGGGVGRLLLAFLAGQLVLSYLIAGVAKVASPVWRNGSCLALILSTDSFGSPGLAAALRTRPALALLLAWGVIGFEVLFAGACALPGVPLWSFFAAGLVLHLTIAVTMGLVNFLFAFTAAYPALLYTVGT